MPNACTSTIEIEVADGHSPVAILRRIQNEAGAVDFNLIVPPPDNLFRGNLGRDGRAECKSDGHRSVSPGYRLWGT
jgi:hypothetical protein